LHHVERRRHEHVVDSVSGRPGVVRVPDELGRRPLRVQAADVNATTAQSPDLNATAAQWQSALDAASRALEADRAVLPAAAVTREAHHLVEERRETAALLRTVAAVHHLRPAPWLAPSPVTPLRLGLPVRAEVCLFDLDGVLTDSDALHAAAWAEALEPVLLARAHEGRAPYAPFDHDTDYHAYFDGKLRAEGIRLFLAGRGLRLPDAAISDIARRKGELLEHGLHSRGVAALAGAHRYLQAVGLGGLGRAVVSASTTASPMLEAAGLAGLIDARVDASTMRTSNLRSRPAPDLLLTACAELGAPPERAISLTHSGAGVVAARRIGMPVIGIASGAEADALLAYGADTVVPALALLLDRSLRAA
jgi:beta-phosphoglucomutase-like phosphatase (HAD superfamily)